MENHGKSQELDIKEIIKAAREAMHNKDWILKQISGDQAGEVPAQEGHNGDRASVSTRDEEEPQNEAKKRQRNANRGAKKGGKKEADELPEAGPSKRAKAKTGEKISAIVQECLKSMAPLLFAKLGARNTDGSVVAEPKGDTTCRDTREKGAPAAGAAMPRDQCPSPDRGEVEATFSGSRAAPTQAWGKDNKADRRRQRSPSTRAWHQRHTKGRASGDLTW
ncbi:hypothetical protein NDU88_004310 [Pleurodeles waltl]|uniref:Uncharacterized protein n=1 Tax=Pleurodeles waltl TaxID=8319 RepID=A0AAV7NJC4_PLEWA|nr:hypothetical protein NDU88_004310 [Pleurodeles waltl]